MGPPLTLLLIFFASKAYNLPLWAKITMILCMIGEFAHHRVLAFKVTKMISMLAASRNQKPFTFLYDEIYLTLTPFVLITGLIIFYVLYNGTLKLYSSQKF